jgi:hypothetical protein
VNRARLIELLSQNACVLREDLDMLDAGTVRIKAFGVDVTREQASRLKANLKRLEQVLAECG